jgi:hypothetical protein
MAKESKNMGFMAEGLETKVDSQYAQDERIGSQYGDTARKG